VTTTPELIESLSQDLQPVTPAEPPLERACIWLLAIIVLVALAAWVTGAWPPLLARLQVASFAIEMAATLATGIAGVAVAFMLSLPDRSRAWVFLPLPSLALWLASSGYGCYRSWLVSGPDGLRLGRSADCFTFIVVFSIPLVAALWLGLRRMAASLDPLRVTAAGGLGVAALSAAALQFWHPFDVTVADLAAHAAAVAIVCAVVIAGGRRGLAGRSVSTTNRANSPV
jgi:hypothetical protein